MKIRTAALLAAPLAACLTMHAQAAVPTKAPAPLVLTDTAGDANGVSGQGIVSSPSIPDGVATPADVSGTDILGVTIAPTGTMVTKKVGKKTTKYFDCTGYTATLTLAAAPLPNGTLYRIDAQSTNNKAWYLEYSLEAGSDPRTYLRWSSDGSITNDDSVDIAPVKIDGSKLVFTVTNKNIKATGEKVNHITLSNLGADVRGNLKVMGGGATVPMYDQLVTDGSQLWKVCPL